MLSIFITGCLGLDPAVCAYVLLLDAVPALDRLLLDLRIRHHLQDSQSPTNACCDSVYPNLDENLSRPLLPHDREEQMLEDYGAYDRPKLL